MSTKAHAIKITELARILGTETAEETARVCLFFGTTLNGDLEVPLKMGAVMDQVLMVGHELNWSRLFEPDEPVEVEVTLDDVFDKGDRRFAVVKSVYASPAGEEIQTQISTFTQPLSACREV